MAIPKDLTFTEELEQDNVERLNSNIDGELFQSMQRYFSLFKPKMTWRHFIETAIKRKLREENKK